MSLLKKLRSPKGFTLVELIIVIMIIGILAATLLPKIMGAPAKARDAAREADFNAMATALELYFADNSRYPLAADIAAATDMNSDSDTGVNDLLVEDGYLKEVLQDPADQGGYTYVYCFAERNGVAGQAFALATRLESSTGAQRNLTIGDSVVVDVSSMSDSVKAVAGADVTSGTYSYTNAVCDDA